MEPNATNRDKIRYCTAVSLLIIIILILYSNSFEAPWRLDDYPNIVKNPKIKIEKLDWPSIQRAVYGCPARDTLYRPVSYLSFGLNWFFNKNDVLGYHIVNIGIHIICSVLLFLVLLKLFSTPGLSRYSDDTAFFTALLTSLIWAIHPIQVQAVTYIVQRMASLAGMFYLLSILFYLTGRLERRPVQRIIYYFVALTAGLLAFGAKQNTVMLPFSILAIEFFFFHSWRVIRLYHLMIIIVSCLIAFSLAILAIQGNPLTYFTQLYSERPFTLTERLLTESRIIVFYISQLFYPTAERFSLVHEYPVSANLFSPVTTLVAILAIVALIIFSIIVRKKRPLWGFAFAFFLINHFVESSFIPLELIFEHRNYIPSMFLFAPFVLSVKKYSDGFYLKNYHYSYLITAAIISLIIILGIGTRARNYVWASNAFWLDALKTAPHTGRVYHNIAWGYYEKKGDYIRALAYYKMALQYGFEIKAKDALTYYAMGNLYRKLGKNSKAIECWRRSLEIIPELSKPHYGLAMLYATGGDYDKAWPHAFFLVNNYPENIIYQWLAGFISLRQKRYTEAISYFLTCLRRQPEDWKNYLYIGSSLNYSGFPQRARWFFRQASNIEPRQAIIRIGYAENCIRNNDYDEAEKQIGELINIVGLEHIDEFIGEIKTSAMTIPIDIDLLSPVIHKAKSSKINELTSKLENLPGLIK